MPNKQLKPFILTTDSIISFNDLKIDTNSIKNPKKKLFIENFCKYRNIPETAIAIGVGVSTAYAWLAADKSLRDKIESIKKQIDEIRLARYEQELDKRALGESKMSDVLLMFALKSLNRDKYGDKPVETKLVGDVMVKLAVPPYREDKSAIQRQIEAKGSGEGSGPKTS